MPEACAVCGCNILCNVSYFDVKTEEERNYFGYGKLDAKKENMCFSRSQVTHPSRGAFIASIITASIFGTRY